VTIGRWLAVAALGGGIFFAIQGGEYSTLALRKLRGDERAERARIAELKRVVDSLTRYAKLVETDPETQERIARERHGMLKAGEHAFILEEPEER
jgi:cell division protein FtsB